MLGPQLEPQLTTERQAVDGGTGHAKRSVQEAVEAPIENKCAGVRELLTDSEMVVVARDVNTKQEAVLLIPSVAPERSWARYGTGAKQLFNPDFACRTPVGA